MNRLQWELSQLSLEWDVVREYYEQLSEKLFLEKEILRAVRSGDD